MPHIYIKVIYRYAHGMYITPDICYIYIYIYPISNAIKSSKSYKLNISATPTNLLSSAMESSLPHMTVSINTALSTAYQRPTKWLPYCDLMLTDVEINGKINCRNKVTFDAVYRIAEIVKRVKRLHDRREVSNIH